MSIQIQPITLKTNYSEAVKECIQEAWLEVHPLAINWVQENVPKKTGALIESFWALLEGETIEAGFNEWYAKWANTMTQRGRFPKESERIAPFLALLRGFIKQKMVEIITRKLNQRRIVASVT